MRSKGTIGVALAGAVVVLLGVFAVVASRGGAPRDAPSLFDAQCAACHVAPGQPASGSRRLIPAGLDPNAYVDAIRNGKADGGMPAFAGALDDEQIRELARYLAAAPGG